MVSFTGSTLITYSFYDLLADKQTDKIIKKIETCSNNLNFEAALELQKELDYIKVVLAKQKAELHNYIK